MRQFIVCLLSHLVQLLSECVYLKSVLLLLLRKLIICISPYLLLLFFNESGKLKYISLVLIVSNLKLTVNLGSCRIESHSESIASL